jgi:hypothetical protein
MIRYITLVLFFLFQTVLSFSQNCKDYWNKDGITTINNSYSIVPEGCVSKLLATDESFELPFDLIQCKDYKMAIVTSFNYKAYITLYDRNNGTLIYNNILNDTAQVLEFQVKSNMNVRAVLSLPHNNAKKVVGSFTVKPNRYCVGLRLESMVTKK